MTPLLLGNQVTDNRFDPINNFKKGKGANEPKAQMAGDYPGFLSMKRGGGGYSHTLPIRV